MRRTGFTLIELLVVIAIIAILAAIMFPIFVGAKVAAGRSQCLNNCKQIALGVSMYKDDNQGCWMSCYYQANSSQAGYDPDYRYAFWMRALKPYVKSKNVFTCPSATIEFGHYAKIGVEPKTSWPAANYGINECLVFGIYCPLAGVDSLKRESDILYPSKTALIADCKDILFWGGANFSQDLQVDPDGQTFPDGMMRMRYPNNVTTPYKAKDVRHGGWTSVIFVDLHAKALSTRDFKIINTGTANVRMYPIIWPKAKPF
jgi:prepilin-type N-terminal cleavage/methylation domain-containing protein